MTKVLHAAEGNVSTFMINNSIDVFAIFKTKLRLDPYLFEMIFALLLRLTTISCYRNL